ncbi:transporter, betaine/carnitine/choline transporter (BCCT) family [Methylorubrum extorquens]|uniref:Transporter, betaine/carnitine/choline transporter (BCCT) family n=1 Tax=Methylorubrum extorquens TaxID=408 RepID=A0A2N9AJN4_METEX|nr:BCCT family transporter [Methylorubrum zatmanii]ARO53391.1 choline transporter [Methylorubrum zatmanii]SOR27533.1 transporter, betaine/carnitine/choline transporter (BCCT) family [Methylorubrum extorquens]
MNDLNDRRPLGRRGPRMQVNPPVFFTSAGLTLAFAGLSALFPAQAKSIFDSLQATIVHEFGWFYIAVVAGFLGFAIFLMLSRYGDVKLGPDDSEPDYSYLSWFAMLFSAGMGIGLIFFGVAEPLQHYATPPVGEGKTIEAAQRAMVLTFFHWGVHAWAIYIVVGLALAYFAFRRGLPLTVRSALHPLIGDRINGPIGHAIDIFAVLGTIFGVATSLGLGVLQVNAGFTHLFGVPNNTFVQIILIAAITGCATLSVASGLDKGVKVLSELNIILAVVLLAFVLITGSTVFLLQAFVQNLGAYLGAVVERTLQTYAYKPNEWLGSWTLFYWGWWIAWSPFVGMFIARISRGRTIREFVTGVLLVPVLFTFFWMTVFGNTAIEMDRAGAVPLAQIVKDNMPVALFEMLGHLPFGMIASGLATLLVIFFFVTSADSGALVIDMITSGAADNPPLWQRVFWAVSSGAIAAVLLVAGGLEALQTAAIASALPFSIVMIFICYGLLRALQLEGRSGGLDLSSAAAGPSGGLSWQERLAAITHSYRREDLKTFLDETVAPALEAVAGQMRESGLSPEVVRSAERIDLIVPYGDRGAFRYGIRVRGLRNPSFAWAENPSKSSDERHYRALVQTSEGDRPHDVTGYGRDRVIDDLLKRYAQFRAVRGAA